MQIRRGVEPLSPVKPPAVVSAIYSHATGLYQWGNQDVFQDQDQDQDFKIISRPRLRPSLVFKTKTLHLKTKTIFCDVY